MGIKYIHKLAYADQGKKMNVDIYAPQARLFKVLMHPVRIAILDLLREDEECVCHMEAFLGFRQAYISQHLMVLREAGLVTDRRDGWNIFYRVSRPEIYEVLDSAARMLGIPPAPRLIQPPEHLCPCPKCNLEVESTGEASQ